MIIKGLPRNSSQCCNQVLQTFCMCSIFNTPFFILFDILNSRNDEKSIVSHSNFFFFQTSHTSALNRSNLIVLVLIVSLLPVQILFNMGFLDPFHFLTLMNPQSIKASTDRATHILTSPRKKRRGGTNTKTVRACSYRQK